MTDSGPRYLEENGSVLVIKRGLHRAGDSDDGPDEIPERAGVKISDARVVLVGNRAL